MDLNLEKKTNINTLTHFLIYTVEKSNSSNPYIYFYMIKTNNDIITLPTLFIKSIQDCSVFMNNNFKSFEYKYIGTDNYNNENIVVYELLTTEPTITNTYHNENWWKVMPFELLYLHKVLNYTIEQYWIEYFKLNPQLLFVIHKNKKYEVPIVAYIGIDSEELNHQILMSDNNYYKGHFGNGYHFLTLEEAYYNSLYDNVTHSNNIIKLPNKNYISYNTPYDNQEIIVKNNKFYLNNIFIGNVPKLCNGTTYTLYKFNSNYIYIKSKTKLENCKYLDDSFIQKQKEGYVMRYALFLKDICYTKKKGCDSYFYIKKKPYWFPYYMVKTTNQFSLLSYHTSQFTEIENNYIFNKNKKINVFIK